MRSVKYLTAIQISGCSTNIWMLMETSWKTLHPSEDMEGLGGNDVGEHGLVDCSSAGGCFDTSRLLSKPKT